VDWSLSDAALLSSGGVVLVAAMALGR